MFRPRGHTGESRYQTGISRITAPRCRRQLPPRRSSRKGPQVDKAESVSTPCVVTIIYPLRWHGTRGSDKVIFASDYPLLDLQKTTTAARGLALPDADLRRVLYENARRLLFQ